VKVLSEEVTLKIDGKEVKAKKEMSILQVARANGVKIPTLCYNEQMKPYGACRMCMVEIVRRGRRRLVSSCVYPVEEGLEVVTNNERIGKLRHMIIELLLPLADTGPIRELAEKYGVTKSRFEAEPTKCILCGLCVRYCAEVKKENAICFIGRGTKREVAPIPEIAPNVCMVCRECYSLCPGGKIEELLEDIHSLSIPISERK